MRFLPLHDNDVNILICKDADGIITNLDCKYIKSFETGKEIFYVEDVGNGNSFVNIKNSEYIYYTNPFFGINLNYTHAYSYWLKYYVKYEKEFYDNNFSAFITLLAGCSGFKLKIKEDIFNIKKDEIFIILKEINKIQSELSGKSINFAFDELFLKHLFRDYLSVKINLSEEEYYLQRNKIINSVKYIKSDTIIDISKIKLSSLIDLYNEHGIEQIKAPTLNILDSDTDEEIYYKTNIINKFYNNNSFNKRCDTKIINYNFNAITSLILCDLLNYNQTEDKIYDYINILFDYESCQLSTKMYLSYFINLNQDNDIYINIINYIYWYFQKDIMKLI
jgi:hypothetical protein